MSNFAHPFDARLEHRAVGSAALTSATVIDTITQRAAMRTAYRTIVGVESIDIGDGEPGDSVDHAGKAQQDRVEPAATAWAPGGGTKLATEIVEVI